MEVVNGLKVSGDKLKAAEQIKVSKPSWSWELELGVGVEVGVVVVGYSFGTLKKDPFWNSDLGSEASGHRDF